MTIEVKELRVAERYVFNVPLAGSFGPSEVTLVNIGTGGVQITHPLPLRIGSSARFSFRIRDVAAATNGRLIWSHLSKTRDAAGNLSYRSGVRIEDASFADAVAALAERRIIQLDADSLERKRQRLLEKERSRSDKHLLVRPATEPTVSAEQLLLIEHARERLRMNPNEASRLYELARTADAAPGMRQDVLAVWEYLERSIALATITRVLESR
jgi:hypothetical protein